MALGARALLIILIRLILHCVSHYYFISAKIIDSQLIYMHFKTMYMHAFRLRFRFKFANFCGEKKRKNAEQKSVSIIRNIFYKSVNIFSLFMLFNSYTFRSTWQSCNYTYRKSNIHGKNDSGFVCSFTCLLSKLNNFRNTFHQQRWFWANFMYRTMCYLWHSNIHFSSIYFYLIFILNLFNVREVWPFSTRIIMNNSAKIV